MLTKKVIAANKAYAKQTDPRDVAYGRVIGGDVHPGPYRILPVLGWMRKEKGVIGVTLSCILLRIYDDKHMGSLGWNIPVNERTEKAVCRALTSFGWDGRIWPLDPGWPDGGDEARGFQQLLHESHLFSSFVFPPEPQGSRVLRVDVMALSKPFALPPEFPAEDVVEPTEDHMAKLRRLMVEPDLFLRDGQAR